MSGEIMEFFVLFCIFFAVYSILLLGLIVVIGFIESRRSNKYGKGATIDKSGKRHNPQNG